jgi:hypothetical protein
MGLIAVGITIKALYEDHDRRKRNNENAKTVASQIQSVRFNLSTINNQLNPVAPPCSKQSFTESIPREEGKANERS